MASIGETLRNARLQKKVSEETVAKVLKIKIEKVKDLEENRFDRFAAPVYVRSFIRNYANYLLIDAKALVEQYEKEFPAPERQPIFDVKEDPRAHTFVRHNPPAKAQGMALTSTGKAVLTASVVLVVVGVIAIYFLSLATDSRSTNVSTTENEKNSSSSDTLNTSSTTSTNSTLTTSSVSSSTSTNGEPWKLPAPPKLDSSLTYSPTNTTSSAQPPSGNSHSSPVTPPTSVPGQSVKVP